MSRLTRKTGLARGKPLDRGGGLKRGGKLRRVVGPPASPAEVAAMAEFHRLAEGRAARCAVCGHGRTAAERRDLEVHHVVPRRDVRLVAPEREWDPANGLPLCDEPAPNRCHTRHELAVRRVPRSALRPENLQFAEALGLGWYIDSTYPGEGP